MFTWWLQFKPEMVDLVYNCAKFKYECGNYTEASEYLYFYRVLVSGVLLNPTMATTHLPCIANPQICMCSNFNGI